MPGISDNIRVFSIVDRFLEHSRMYVFSPDAEAKVFLSSADWMPRNFHRRVEVMFPVEAADLKDRILHEIIPAYQRDNTRKRVLHSDATYGRLVPAEGEEPFRVQEELLAIRAGVRPVERPVIAEDDGIPAPLLPSGLPSA
jgi:polyphosphate kinase